MYCNEKGVFVIKNISKAIAIFIAVFLLFALVSCSKPSPDDTQSTTLEDTTEKVTVPYANLSAQDLEPGMAYHDDTSSDYFYPNGEEGSSYIYFTHGDSLSGRIVTFVNDGVKTADFHLQETAEKHLVPEENDAQQNGFTVDFMIYDNFNVYDNISKTWYSRGDQNATNAMFAGKTFADIEGGDASYTFYDDGTAQYINADYTASGLWEVKSPTVLVFVTDDGYKDTLNIEYNDDGSLKDIVSFVGTYAEK